MIRNDWWNVFGMFLFACLYPNKAGTRTLKYSATVCGAGCGLLGECRELYDRKWIMKVEARREDIKTDEKCLLHSILYASQEVEVHSGVVRVLHSRFIAHTTTYTSVWIKYPSNQWYSSCRQWVLIRNILIVLWVSKCIPLHYICRRWWAIGTFCLIKRTKKTMGTQFNIQTKYLTLLFTNFNEGLCYSFGVLVFFYLQSIRH